MVAFRNGHLAAVVLAVVGVGAGAPNLSVVEAVKGGVLSVVQAELKRARDVNVPERDRTTALHWAVHQRDLAIAEALIGAGADVGARNDYGVNPLWLACVNGDAPIIELLLNAGADPNTTMAEGDTALMTAARSGSAEAVRVLLKRGANPNATERSGQTALMWVAADNHTAVIETLIEAGADIRARTKGLRGFTPLLFAVRSGSLEAVRALLDAGADVNDELTGQEGMKVNALILAITNAHYDVASLLLDRGADPNRANAGWTALHEMTWMRKPNGGNTNPVPVARGQVDSMSFLKRLLAAGADVNTQITVDAGRGGLHGSHALVTKGATPFLLAAFRADLPFMRLLLAHGADPRLPNAIGTSPMMAAAGVGYLSDAEPPFTAPDVIEAFNLCLEFDGDVNRVDENGDTALHGAAFRGINQVVQVLIDRGARLDVRNKERQNPFLTWNRAGNWTPWRIAEGVFWGNGFSRKPETAALLRRVMEQQGLPLDEQESGSVAQPRP